LKEYAASIFRRRYFYQTTEYHIPEDCIVTIVEDLKFQTEDLLDRHQRPLAIQLVACWYNQQTYSEF
jgi:hypothetical protein